MIDSSVPLGVLISNKNLSATALVAPGLATRQRATTAIFLERDEEGFCCLNQQHFCTLVLETRSTLALTYL
jgi:hypothetical protein